LSTPSPTRWVPSAPTVLHSLHRVLINALPSDDGSFTCPRACFTARRCAWLTHMTVVHILHRAALTTFALPRHVCRPRSPTSLRATSSPPPSATSSAGP
jgi:hypothetical protein